MSKDIARQATQAPWIAAGRERLRIVMLGLGDRDDVAAEAEKSRRAIDQYADVVLTDFQGNRDLAQVEADLAIVIGGDGAILRAGLQMGDNQIPVLAVNMGKLGFLANISPAELLRVLPGVCRGECRVVEHLMFHCRVMRQQRVLAERLGLNETAVLGGAPFSMLHLNLYVDSELATTYSCDGLIISTPVGSTAHSLSAGGPILRKSLSAFVIVPISPHTLTVRPVVDSADHEYQVALAEPNEATWVVVDGRELCKLTEYDRVVVRRAEPRFRLVEVHGHSYYGTLRQKLGWSGRIQHEKEEGRGSKEDT